MTDSEAIAVVRAGGRCETEFTFKEFRLTPEHNHFHRERVVACDNETDVLECMDCGRQRHAVCDYYDDCR